MITEINFQEIDTGSKVLNNLGASAQSSYLLKRRSKCFAQHK